MKRLEAIVAKERNEFSWDRIIFQLLKLEIESKVVKVAAKKPIKKKTAKVEKLFDSKGKKEETETSEEVESEESLTRDELILNEFYRLEARTFYEQARVNYESMYAHMGQAREYKIVPEAFAVTGRKISGNGSYERKGELTANEARSIVEKVTLAKMTGNFSRLSFAERESFCNWRMFNKSMRRMFEASSGYGNKKGPPMALV
tara:strand:+ start:1704 stop:2312 length:609 start_codon:yes stop_codon:yes gene_type:complete